MFIQTYLLFSLLTKAATAIKSKEAQCFLLENLSSLTLYQLPTSHTQTPPGIFTWCVRPVWLCLDRYTLDEFGTARRSAVVRGFIDALTRGGPGGTPRPIEMHSHDPMRYISLSEYSLVTLNTHTVLRLQRCRVCVL